MTLVCTILAAASHFHSPAHSPRYLLALLILSFPTLLIALLAFLVDILLFIPHLEWGGWIVLAATIIICACSILTCAMRRTLVSRKARKKRIAENPDMNGANFYQGSQEPKLLKETPQVNQEAQFARAESPPPIGVAGNPNKLPTFAAYDFSQPRPSTDDRTPLNRRDPSVISSTSGGRQPGAAVQNSRRAPPPGPVATNGYNGEGRRSPVSPIEYEGPPQGMAREHSERGQRFYGGPVPPRGRGGPPPFQGRGRGGYPPQRGGHGPPPMRGGPGMRGGPPPSRGPYPRGGPNGMRGGPPPGWHGDRGMAPMAAGAGAGMATGAMMGRGHRGPPPGYGRDYYDGPPARDPYYMQNQEQRPYNDFADASPYSEAGPTPRALSDRGYGQPGAYGADAALERRPSAPNSRQSPSATPAGGNSRSNSKSREAASFGFSGRNPSPGRSGSRAREPSPPPPMPPLSNETLPIGQAVEMDATSGSPARSPVYPPGHDGPVSPIPESNNYTAFPLHRGQSPTGGHPAELGVGSPRKHHDLGVTGPAPVELPGSEEHIPIGTATAGIPSQTHQTRPSNDNYYEDVDPQFADRSTEPPPPQQHQAPLPSSLMPGHLHPGYGNTGLTRDNSSSSIYSGDDPTHRTRSPAATSDNSNFTSISQRGVNPNWAAHYPPSGPQSAYGGSDPGGARRIKRDDTQVLASNPDFSLEGVGPPRGHGRTQSRGGSGGRATGRPVAGSLQGGPYPGM